MNKSLVGIVDEPGGPEQLLSAVCEQRDSGASQRALEEALVAARQAASERGYEIVSEIIERVTGQCIVSQRLFRKRHLDPEGWRRRGAVGHLVRRQNTDTSPDAEAVAATLRLESGRDREAALVRLVRQWKAQGRGAQLSRKALLSVLDEYLVGEDEMDALYAVVGQNLIRQASITGALDRLPETMAFPDASAESNRSGAPHER
jgi:hypothetical protein